MGLFVEFVCGVSPLPLLGCFVSLFSSLPGIWLTFGGFNGNREPNFATVCSIQPFIWPLSS